MSKFFPIFVSIFLCSLYSQAQIKRGTRLLGGNVNFGSTSDHNSQGNNSYTESITGFGINPSAGYFIADNLAIGLGLGYSTANGEVTSNSSSTPSKSSSHSFSLGPFVRYYKMLNEQISIFGQGSATVAFGKSESLVFNPQQIQLEGKTSSLKVGFRPGIVWFATQRLAFEATYGVMEYSHKKVTTSYSDGSPTIKNNENYFNLSFNPSSFNFGLWYYPGR